MASNAAIAWAQYERRKAAWVQAHPMASSEEYEQAARHEFRGEQLRRDSSTERKADLSTAFPCVPN